MKVVLTIFSLFLMTSCVTLQHARLGKAKVELTTAALKKLNGNYTQVYPTDISWDHWPMGYLPKYCAGDSSNKRCDQIAVKVLSDHKIRVRIVDGDKVVRRRKFKGTINDGYFEGKTSFVSPFWFLINAYTREKVRIGLLPNRNLVVDVGLETIGLLVLVPFTGERYYGTNIEYVPEQLTSRQTQ